MKFFVFAAVVSVCLADRLPSHFGYASSREPSSAFSHRSRPASRPSFSAPRPAPQPTYSAPRSAPGPLVPILVDDRVHPDAAGAYSFNVETGDGISRQESGSPIPAKEGPVTAMSGSYSFTLPDGQKFELRYVRENGFQPDSAFLPVAPAFPHPIPAHALEQIERARQEDAARSRQGSSQGYSAPVPSRSSRPSNSYGFPQ
nr:pupal cuticle protein 20-like [Penaeus vannamei]